jgi:recombination protein RecA
MADDRKKRAEKLAAEGIEKYGQFAAITGSTRVKTTFYSSGSPTLDYMLGTGGFPSNGFVEVFGPPEIGKSTIFISGVLASVQRAGGITAIIATEPNVDEDWLARHGVNPDYNVVYRPDTGEDAFEILKDLVFNRRVDYFGFDSIAGISSAKAQDSDKPQAFGNAALIANGINNVRSAAYKNNVGGIFINQIRDLKNPKGLPMVKPPGGWAVKHAAGIRLQIKPGKNKTVIKVPSSDNKGGGATEDLIIGKEIRVVIDKDNYAEQLGSQAVFWFYHIEAPDYPFGIDYFTDLFNIAKVTGVITGAGWLNHEVFPDGKIQGAPAAKKYLEDNPKAAEQIQKEVTAIMHKREDQAQRAAASQKKADKT